MAWAALEEELGDGTEGRGRRVRLSRALKDASARLLATARELDAARRAAFDARPEGASA